MADSQVVIIGAGLAGLNAALTLQEADIDVTVIDGSDRVGGRVATDEVDGFKLDRGFQLINSKYPEIERLDILKKLDFVFAPRTVQVALDGKQVALGDPRENLFSALDGATGSVAEKLKLIKYLTQSSKSGVSVASELNGLGKTYERVLRPFLTGVFLADPNEIEASVGRELINSFVTGAPGLPKNGAGVLPAVMAKSIKNLKLKTRAEAITKNGVRTNKGLIKSEQVIVATDLSTAAQLLDINSVPDQVGCTTWYHVPDYAPTNYATLLLDGMRSGPIVNSIVISNLMKNYAPKGKAIVASTTITRASESEVRRQLASMWDAPTKSWELIAKYEIPAALPLAAVGSRLVNTSRIAPGRYVAGDWRESPSQNGALKSGRRAAQNVIKALSR
ncbi:MAG: hypothetical protein RL448_581 [Actinomycetota bacterium]